MALDRQLTGGVQVREYCVDSSVQFAVSVEANLGEDAADVVLHGPRLYVKRFRDGPVAVGLGHVGQNLELPTGKALQS